MKWYNGKWSTSHPLGHPTFSRFMQTHIWGHNNQPIIYCKRMIHSSARLATSNECIDMDRSSIYIRTPKGWGQVSDESIHINWRDHKGKTREGKLVPPISWDHHHHSTIKLEGRQNSWEQNGWKMASKVNHGMVQYTTPPSEYRAEFCSCGRASQGVRALSYTNHRLETPKNTSMSERTDKQTTTHQCQHQKVHPPLPYWPGTKRTPYKREGSRWMGLLIGRTGATPQGFKIDRPENMADTRHNCGRRWQTRANEGWPKKGNAVHFFPLTDIVLVIPQPDLDPIKTPLDISHPLPQ